jgi:hypothetical protein
MLAAIVAVRAFIGTGDSPAPATAGDPSPHSIGDPASARNSSTRSARQPIARRAMVPVAVEATRSRASTRAPAPLATPRHLYEHATDKRLLFDTLRDSGSVEGFYFAARILDDCFDVAEHGIDSVVRSFVGNLPLDAPGKGEQIAAFRQLVEPCYGFDGRTIRPAEIELLYAAGAYQGDPRSIAHLLGSAGIDRVTESIQKARVLLEHRDPYVIAGVSNFLAGLYAQGHVIDGNALDPSQNAPVAMAWTLVACDFGAECSTSNNDVLRACAHGGLCEVHSLEDLFRLTLVDDETYRRGQYYRERILLALQRRDFASLGLDASRL